MLRTQLFQDLPITVIRSDASCAHITDLTEDSRTVMPGSLFIARTGLKSDGLDFVQAAIDSGAAAVLIENTADQSRIPDGPLLAICDDVRMMTAILAERIFGNPSDHLLIAGVTGTNGKSTIAHLVHGLLNRCGVRTGVIGTVGVDDGAEYAPSPMTTPPAIELSRTLATMRDAGCRACVMEVSSHALDQHRAGAINFDAAVFTNLSGDHSDYHPTAEHYLQSKQRLLAMVSQTGLAVLNADDSVVAAAAIPEARTHLCALDPNCAHDADWIIERTHSSTNGETLCIKLGPRTINAAVPLFGPFNAMNILQAVAVAWELLGRAGFDENDRQTKIQSALSLATSPTGRLEPVHGPHDDVSVFVDFAHTDDALDRALAAVRTASDTSTQLTAVFGCGGDRDHSKRPRMGAAAAAHADRIIVTSDNPRSEPPDEIVSAILEGIPGRARSRVTVHIDRERAIREAIASAAPGGAIVIAGKGHETDQITADENGRPVTRRFVDQNIAREALRDRRTHNSTIQESRGAQA